MIVLGLDQAPRFTGFCHGDTASEKPPVWGAHEFENYGENGVLLIRAVRKWMISLCEIVRPEFVYCEQIVFDFRHINSLITSQQFCVIAGIEAACDFLGMECFQIDISKWRKRGLGRGNKPKWAANGEEPWLKEAAKKACLDLGWLIDDHNAAEAALIWDYGCAHVDPEYRRKTAARVTRVRMQMEERERAAA